jgi:hypothetical protein
MGAFAAGSMAIQPLAQTAAGIYQLHRANKLKQDKTVDPILAGQRTADQVGSNAKTLQEQNAEEQINRETSRTKGRARKVTGDVSKVLAVEGAADAAAKEAKVKASTIGANIREKRRGRLRDTNLRISADLRRKRDEYEAAKSELRGSAMQNFFNAATSAGAIGAFAAGGGFDKSGGTTGAKQPSEYVNPMGSPNPNVTPESNSYNNMMMDDVMFNRKLTIPDLNTTLMNMMGQRRNN